MQRIKQFFKQHWTLRKLVSPSAREISSENCTWISLLQYDWLKQRQELWRLKEELQKDSFVAYSI
jgi:hypothetical protein